MNVNRSLFSNVRNLPVDECRCTTQVTLLKHERNTGWVTSLVELTGRLQRKSAASNLLPVKTRRFASVVKENRTALIGGTMV
jgi:hypothetical protein